MRLKINSGIFIWVMSICVCFCGTNCLSDKFEFILENQTSWDVRIVSETGSSTVRLDRIGKQKGCSDTASVKIIINRPTNQGGSYIEHVTLREHLINHVTISDNSIEIEPPNPWRKKLIPKPQCKCQSRSYRYTPTYDDSMGSYSEVLRMPYHGPERIEYYTDRSQCAIHRNSSDDTTMCVSCWMISLGCCFIGCFWCLSS